MDLVLVDFLLQLILIADGFQLRNDSRQCVQIQVARLNFGITQERVK